jgi:mannosyl-3-phosphoglycerate phosphatase
MTGRVIIFTDLDGTLLDSKYSFKKALPALKVIKEKDIPLILCSSKTRAEIEHCRRKLRNNHPFISENGGGIFIPKKYFRSKIQNLNFNILVEKNYFVIKLGTSYSRLRNALKELRSKGFAVKGFGDMTVKEIAQLTGLKISDARTAKKRDFDEPFVFHGDKTSVTRLKQCIKAKGFNYTQGEFFHIMGNSNDKGKAVEILKALYRKQDGRIVTIALGNSPNDIEMLKNADYPVVVQKEDGSYDKRVKIKRLIKANGIGPEGWNNAILNLLQQKEVT